MAGDSAGYVWLDYVWCITLGHLWLPKKLKPFLIKKIWYNYKLLPKISWVVFTTEENNTEFKTSCTAPFRVLPAVSCTKYAVIWLTIKDTRAAVSDNCAKDKLDGFGIWGITHSCLFTSLGCYGRLARAASGVMRQLNLPPLVSSESIFWLWRRHLVRRP